VNQHLSVNMSQNDPLAFGAKKADFQPFTVPYFTVYMVQECINTLLHCITVLYRITVHCTVHRTGATLVILCVCVCV